MRIGSFVALGCFWFSAAGPAAALPFALEYQAPEGCPSREAFVEAIRERVPNAHESEQAERFTFRVTIESAGDQARGSLEIGDGAAVRQVVPAPCADVANSMVLMIAIVLTGENQGSLQGRFGTAKEREEEREPKAASDTPLAPVNAAVPVNGAVPASPKPRPASEPAANTTIHERRAPASPPERGSFRGGAWGAAGFSDGVAPFPAIAVSGGAELEIAWAGALKPSLRAGVTYASGDTSVGGVGGAEFRLLAFAGRLCPHAFLLSRRWALAGCASVELGELTASGVRTPNRRVERMPWFALGVAPRVELALDRTFSFDGELGLRAIVRHDRFIFEPDATEVYDVPRFAPHLSLGASARFP